VWWVGPAGPPYPGGGVPPGPLGSGWRPGNKIGGPFLGEIFWTLFFLFPGTPLGEGYPRPPPPPWVGPGRPPPQVLKPGLGLRTNPGEE